MVTGAKPQLYRLTDDETGITGSDLATASIWQQIYKYQVPVDRRYIFRPGHTFSAYLEDNESSAAEFTDATSRVRVLLREANEMAEVKLVQDTNYVMVKEFTDRDLVKRLDISQPVVARPGMWVIIEAYPSLSFDASDSYFEITCDMEVLHLF